MLTFFLWSSSTRAERRLTLQSIALGSFSSQAGTANSRFRTASSLKNFIWKIHFHSLFMAVSASHPQNIEATTPSKWVGEVSETFLRNNFKALHRCPKASWQRHTTALSCLPGWSYTLLVHWPNTSNESKRHVLDLFLGILLCQGPWRQGTVPRQISQTCSTRPCAPPPD